MRRQSSDVTLVKPRKRKIETRPFGIISKEHIKSSALLFCSDDTSTALYDEETSAHPSSAKSQSTTALCSIGCKK